MQLRHSQEAGELFTTAHKLALLRNDKPWREITVAGVVRVFAENGALDYLRTLKPAELDRLGPLPEPVIRLLSAGTRTW